MGYAALKLNTLHAMAAAPQMSLRGAIDYTLAGRGSGVRRELATAVGRACGMRTVDALELAQSVELFHHASLLLDDLPCMDDADERRGRTCLHRVAGEAQAILAALALINQAYTGCWSVAANYPLRAAVAAKLVATCMGERGILKGQSRDLHFRVGLGAAEVRGIAVQKTGMLLKLALVLPAVLGGADWRTLLRLTRLAYLWGRLYQAIDDFSDLLLLEQDSGKTPFRDVRKERPNLVVALGPDAASLELLTLEAKAGLICRSLFPQCEDGQVLQQFHARIREKTTRIRVAMEAA